MKRFISLMCATVILLSLVIAPVDAGTITPWTDYDDEGWCSPALRAEEYGGFSWTSGNFSRRFSGDIKLGYYDSTVSYTDTARGCWVSSNKDTSATVTDQWISTDGKTVIFDYTAELDLMPDENSLTTYDAVFVVFFSTVGDTSKYTKFTGGVDGYEFVRHVPAGTFYGEEQMESGRITYTLPDNFDPEVHLVGYAIWCIEDAPFVPRDDDYHYGNTYLSPTIYTTPVKMLDMTKCHVGDPSENPGDADENIFTYTVKDGEVKVTGVDKSASGDVTVPSHVAGLPVTAIGKMSFLSIPGITGITLPDTMRTIEDGSMMYLPSLKRINVPAGVENIGKNFLSGCTSLEEITVSPENEHFKAVDGALLTKDGKEFVTYPMGKGTTEYTVPDGVESIRAAAFFDCATITDITLPDTVTFIGKDAFDGTGVHKDAISKGTPLYIGSCLIETTASTITTFTVKDGTTVIGESAFAGCDKLKNITVPESVTHINSGAFDGCTGLGEVFFGGTSDKWTEITVGEKNDCLLSAGRIHRNVDSVEDHYVYTITKEPTCTDNGSAEYICPCGYAKDFEVLPSTGHSYTARDGKVPTCTEDGWTPYRECLSCGVLSGYSVEKAKGHTVTEHPAKSPTCTESGWFAYEECTVCDHTTYVEISPYGHDTVRHEKKDPTFTEIGWKEYETCTRCDYSTYTELPRLTHERGDANTDGKISLSDVSLMLKYIAAWENIDLNISLCDMNGNGRIDLTDVSTTLKIIAGWNV